MPLLGLIFLNNCYLQNPVNPKLDWIPLEIKHRGQLHELNKVIQEEQGEIDCYV